MNTTTQVAWLGKWGGLEIIIETTDDSGDIIDDSFTSLTWEIVPKAKAVALLAEAGWRLAGPWAKPADPDAEPGWVAPIERA